MSGKEKIHSIKKKIKEFFEQATKYPIDFRLT